MGSMLISYSVIFNLWTTREEGSVTKLKVCRNLNPATFLPEKENETPNHDFSQFLTLNYAALEDLMDTLLDNSDMEIFADGSYFVWDGKHKAGYTVWLLNRFWKQNLSPREPVLS